MNKTRLTILLILFAGSHTLYSIEPAFKTGEKLTFKIRYGFITAGNAEISTSEKEIAGIPVFHTKVEAKTTGFFDQLYKLYDIFESSYDAETGLPYLSVTNLSEGKYRFYDEVTFRHDEMSVSSQKRDTTLALEKETFDVVSAIYYFRRINWEHLNEGDAVALELVHDSPPFTMLVVYKGKEEITIGSSKYQCRKFAPVIDQEKIFQKKENMTIWFSDDQNKVPVSIRFNLLIGSFRMELDGYENLLYPFDTRTTK